MLRRYVGWLSVVLLALGVAVFAFLHFSPDYNMYVVRGESMEPAVNMGDVVVTGPLGGQIRPGEVITYGRGEELVIHRVLSIEGEKLVTKGDAVEDPDLRPVALSDVRGSYLFRLPYLGYLSNFIRTTLGWCLMSILLALVLVGFLIRDKVKERRQLKEVTPLKQHN